MVGQILPVSVENASVVKKGKRLLGPLDLKLGEVGLTIVMGPNGSGKTTLLRMLHGLERCKTGAVRWQCELEQARKYQSFVFQSPVLLRRSVRENLVYPLRLTGVKREHLAAVSTSWLERVRLSDKANMPAHFLSGGERQKLALARALVSDPQILFLDEPTANLDGSSTKDIERLLLEVKNDGLRIVMTTHDVAQARRLADDVIFLYNGQLAETATAESFFNKAITVQANAFLKGDIVE